MELLEIIKVLLPLAYASLGVIFVLCMADSILTATGNKKDLTEKEYYHSLHMVEQERFDKVLEAFKKAK